MVKKYMPILPGPAAPSSVHLSLHSAQTVQPSTDPYIPLFSPPLSFHSSLLSNVLFNLYILFCDHNYMYSVYRLTINIKHLHYYTDILFIIDKSMVTFPFFGIVLCVSKITIFLFYIFSLALLLLCNPPSLTLS